MLQLVNLSFFKIKFKFIWTILEASNHLVICAYRSFCLWEHFIWSKVGVIVSSSNEFPNYCFFSLKWMTFATIYNLIELNNKFLATQKITSAKNYYSSTKDMHKLFHILYLWISIRIESNLTFVENLMGKFIDPQHEKNETSTGKIESRHFNNIAIAKSIWKTY